MTVQVGITQRFGDKVVVDDYYVWQSSLWITAHLVHRRPEIDNSSSFSDSGTKRSPWTISQPLSKRMPSKYIHQGWSSASWWMKRISQPVYEVFTRVTHSAVTHYLKNDILKVYLPGSREVPDSNSVDVTWHPLGPLTELRLRSRSDFKPIILRYRNYYRGIL